MANEVLLNEVIVTWQTHTVEVEIVPLEEIRRRAARFQRAVRLWNAFYYAIGAISVIAYGRLLFLRPSLLSGFGISLILVGALCAMYQMHKGRSARPVPADLGVAHVDFHRRELERQRDFLLRSWRYLLLPLPGLAVLFIAWRLPHQTLASAESAVLVALYLFAIAMARRRQARKLQDEIDGLEDGE